MEENSLIMKAMMARRSPRNSWRMLPLLPPLPPGMRDGRGCWLAPAARLGSAEGLVPSEGIMLVFDGFGLVAWVGPRVGQEPRQLNGGEVFVLLGCGLVVGFAGALGTPKAVSLPSSSMTKTCPLMTAGLCQCMLPTCPFQSSLPVVGSTALIAPLVWTKRMPLIMRGELRPMLPLL